MNTIYQKKYQQQILSEIFSSNYLLDLPVDIKEYIIKQQRTQKICQKFISKFLTYYAQPNYYLLSITDEEKFNPKYIRYKSLEQVINKATKTFAYYPLVYIESVLTYHNRDKSCIISKKKLMSGKVEKVSLTFCVRHFMSIWAANSTRDASGNRMNAVIKIMTYDKYTNPNDEEDDDIVNLVFSLYLINDPTDPSIPLVT